MSTRLTMLPRETCVLPPEDHELLHEALAHWYDKTVFSDEKVAQVKPAFQRWLVETVWNKQRHFDCVLCLLQSEPSGPVSPPM